MILYAIMILIAWVIVVGLNVLVNPAIETWYVIVAVVISTVAVIAIDAITATVVRLLPKKWFNPFFKRFKVFRWEKNFYHKLGIKKWKDLVPEIGHFTGFRKNKVKEPTNNEYIYRYLMEACYGRVGHFASFFTGFAIIFLYPLKYWNCFGLPVAIVNLIMNSMSWMILRYNTPKLLAVYKRNEKLALANNSIE